MEVLLIKNRCMVKTLITLTMFNPLIKMDRTHRIAREEYLSSNKIMMEIIWLMSNNIMMMNMTQILFNRINIHTVLILLLK